jgi:Matrixin
MPPPLENQKDRKGVDMDLQMAIDSLDQQEWRRIQDFLAHYGYARDPAATIGALENAEAERPVEGLRKFQEFYRLEGGGDEELLQATIRAIREPRCGLRDLEGGEPGALGCPWPAAQERLIYRVENRPVGLTQDETNGAIAEAIDIWNAALQAAGIALAFKEQARGQGELHVRFSWIEEGPEIVAVVGTPVAHADFPPACGVLGSDLPRPVVFNPNEPWAPDSSNPNRHSILAVALHELGHILGLPHSDVPESLMFPALLRDDRLTPEDLESLRRLYQPANPEALPLNPPVEDGAHP